MGRAVIILSRAEDRDKAKGWIEKAPAGTRVEFKSSKRSIPQNDRLHAMITTIAEELVWHGQKLSMEDWKLVFMDALNRELRIVPNIRGDGFVNLGRRTSNLTKDEFSDLMEVVEAFAAKHEISLEAVA